MNQNIYYSNQIAAEPELHSCFKCSWEGRGLFPACPRCGGVLYSAQNVRTRGGLLIGLGLFLCVFMGGIAIFVTGLLMKAANDPRSSARLENEGHMIVLAYLTFGSVIAIGIAAIAAGAYMRVYGRRNMILIKIFLGLIGLMMAICGIVSAVAL